MKKQDALLGDPIIIGDNLFSDFSSVDVCHGYIQEKCPIVWQEVYQAVDDPVDFIWRLRGDILNYSWDLCIINSPKP